MLQVERQYAAQRKNFWFKRSEEYEAYIKQNQNILEWAAITQRIAFEAALGAATMGLAMHLTASIRTAWMARAGAEGASVTATNLARFGRAAGSAAEGSAEFAISAAANTVGRLCAFGAQQLLVRLPMGQLSIDGFFCGLVLSLVGVPGAGGGASKVTKCLSGGLIQKMGGSIGSLQGLASSAGLFRASAKEMRAAMDRHDEAFLLLVNAMGGTAAGIRQTLETKASKAGSTLYQWSRDNEVRLVRQSWRAVQSKDYRSQVPVLARFSLFGDAHKTLRDNIAGYAEASTGYYLWAGAYETMLQLEQAKIALERGLLPLARPDLQAHANVLKAMEQANAALEAAKKKQQH